MMALRHQLPGVHLATVNLARWPLDEAHFRSSIQWVDDAAAAAAAAISLAGD